MGTVLSYRTAYGEWLKLHLAQSIGERKRKLSEGIGHAESLFLEQVWWPAFENLSMLHPEWEVKDSLDGTRFLDFAIIRDPIRCAIEIDGYGPHWRQATRWQFADHLHRQNDLVLDGWHVLRFSYDEIRERPKRCQQTVQAYIGKWVGNVRIERVIVKPVLKEILQMAIRVGLPVTPSDVQSWIGTCDRTSRSYLRELCKLGFMEPEARNVRVRAYQLAPSAKQMFDS